MLIAMPVDNQPGDLAHSLDSWSRVRPPAGESLEFVFAVEPEADVAPEVIHRYAGTCGWKVEIFQNENRLGPDLNPGHVLEMAFRRSPAVVFAGHSVLVASDVAEYLRWGLEWSEGDAQCLAVCAFEQHGNTSDPSLAHTDFEFSPACFGLWGSRWDRMRNWDFRPSADFHWADYIQQRHLMASGRYVIKPWQSRSQLIAGPRSSSFVADVGPQSYSLTA
jgi:hypothetical protein